MKGTRFAPSVTRRKGGVRWPREGSGENKFERLTEGGCTHWVLGGNRRHAERYYYYMCVCPVKENHQRMAKNRFLQKWEAAPTPRPEGARRRRACAPHSPNPRTKNPAAWNPPPRFSSQAAGQLSLLHFALVNGCHIPALRPHPQHCCSIH